MECGLNSQSPGVLAATGLFRQAHVLLIEQIGLLTQAPLRPHFLAAYVTTQATDGVIASAPSLAIPCMGRSTTPPA
jgi:hypothetical protein